MIDKEELKRKALEFGADDVGIGSMDSFTGAPPEMDPRYVAPKAKSIIGLLFRIPRGYIRGNEEGTNFFQYPSMGYGGINEFYAPKTLYELGKYIEDQGYEAVVYRNVGGRGALSDMTGKRGYEESPEVHLSIEERRRLKKLKTYRCVSVNTHSLREGKPAPDVQMHFRIAGYICGLGEIGYSKMLINDKFGPMHRQAFIFTDAEIEPDPMYEKHLCNDCMACAAQCPGKCISKDERVEVKIAGGNIYWGKLDEWGCFAYYQGANRTGNPFIKEGIFKDIPGGNEIEKGIGKITPENQPALFEALANAYAHEIGGYGAPKCGGCLRACYNALERRGVLKNKFKNSFRTQKPWKLEI